MNLEELISSLRSHEIELEGNKPQKKVKSKALKSKGNPEKEESEESSEDDDELSLLSRIGGQYDSTSGKKKSKADKDITCFKCKEPGHYKNECPKLKPKNEFFREKKNVLMATWDDYESSKYNYE